MLRNWIGSLSLMVILSQFIPAMEARAAGASETLLPDNTKGYLSITNWDRLNEHWNKTQLGQLMSDPSMKSFRKDLRRQFEEQFSRARDKLGLTISDLQGVSTGEASAAIVLLKASDPKAKADDMANVILMDVTGNLEKAKGVIETAKANQLKKGAKQSQAVIEGTPVLVFDVPPDPKDPRPQQAIYFLRENLFGAVDSLEVVQGILARAAGKRVGASLAEFAPFQAVMKRAALDAPGWVPQARWFIQPVGYLEAMQFATPEDQRRKDRNLLTLFQSLGYSAIQGVGGYVDFAVEKYEILHRTAVYAPTTPPYEKSMKMMVFPNHHEFAAEPWVPRDIATYSTFYLDVLNAFDNFGSTFDLLFGEQPGAWDEVLNGMKLDPHGPQIDLRAEIVSRLENRVSVLTDYVLPITETSERLLYALPAKDEVKLTAALAKFYRNDKVIRRREVGGFLVYENATPEKAKVPEVQLELPGQAKRRAARQAAQAGSQPMLPNATLTVAHGYFMVASHFDFLKKVLEPAKPKETMGGSIDYRIVSKFLNELAPPQSAARLFTRTDEQYRVDYELLRQGKLRQSETMLAKMLNWYSNPGSKRDASRQQRIDGRQLPDYQIARRHLGPGGTYSVSESGGWFLKGFLLSKEGK